MRPLEMDRAPKQDQLLLELKDGHLPLHPSDPNQLDNIFAAIQCAEVLHLRAERLH